MHPIILLIFALGLWIYAEYNFKTRGRIISGLLVFIIVIGGHHFIAHVANSYERDFYISALKDLSEIEVGEKRKDYDQLILRYTEAAMSDGIITFRGASALKSETRKLKDKYSEKTEPNHTLQTTTRSSPTSTIFSECDPIVNSVRVVSDR